MKLGADRAHFQRPAIPRELRWDERNDKTLSFHKRKCSAIVKKSPDTTTAS